MVKPGAAGAAKKSSPGADSSAAPKGKAVKGKGDAAKKGGKAAPGGKGAPAEDKTEKIMAPEEIEEKANEILGETGGLDIEREGCCTGLDH